MPYYPFNDDIDKITERELVYDIVERLKLGRDFEMLPGAIYRAGTFLLDLFKGLAVLFPTSFLLHIMDVKTAYIHIDAGGTSGTCALPNNQAVTILRAYSEQTQMDVKECVLVSGSANNYTATFSCDIALLKEDYIKIYYY